MDQSMAISLKGVLFDDAGGVLLGLNPRAEWELPGGRPDPQDVTPRDTVRREIYEEVGIDVVVGDLVDIWFYPVTENRRVAVASYLCTGSAAELRLGEEHSDVRFHPLATLDDIPLPVGYVRSIRAAAGVRQGSTS